MRSAKPLDPRIHPTAPERAASWHMMMVKQLAARKTWLLFELRACPECGLPVFRWRRWDEIKHRALWAAVQAANGQMSLASRRLRMPRRTLYSNLPTKLRKRIDEAKSKPKGSEP